LIAVAAYLAVIATIKLLVLGGQGVHLDSGEAFAGVVVMPITATFLYFLVVFSHGFSGDLAARESLYPARLLALPVTSAALVGWPMLYGSLAMATLWLATRLFALWPAGVPVPVFWPALAAAAFLAWTQALTWLPYPLRGLRVIAAVTCLMVFDLLVLFALELKATEPVMLAILAPQVPLAYLVARFAVARARRGDVPDWRSLLAGLGRIGDVRPRGPNHFRSAARAQAWFEWRRHGWSLPGWVAILLPFELALLWVLGDVEVLAFGILLGALVTPVFMAVFAASGGGGGTSGITPFTATRPMTNAQLVAAKLRMALWSTVAAWVLVLIAVPVAVELSGASALVINRWHLVSDGIGVARATVFVLLVVAGLIAATWKQLVQHLYIGLTGRAWLIKGSVFLTLTLLFLVGPIAEWIIDHDRLGALWSAMPLIFAILAGLKMIAAGWIATRLYRTRLVSDRALVTGAACWCVLVLALYGLLVWFFSSPFVPRYLLALVAILAIPLARLSAAPLALAWNRHR
jgi:hypothetical protein